MRYFILLILVINLQLLDAQIYVNRNFMAIENGDSMKSFSFLSKTTFSTEANKRLSSDYHTYQWDIKFSGSFTLFQWYKYRMKFNLSQELNAANDNQIHFNPKGNVWNEEFRFEKYFKSANIYLSFFHRCKHNIDNSGLSDYDNLKDTVSQRTLVLTGLLVGIVSKLNLINPSFLITYSASTEYYMYTEDFRYPSVDKSDDWEDFILSTFFCVKPEYQLSEKAGTYLMAWINPVYFKGNYLKSNYRLEAGFYLQDKSYRFYFYLANEYWFNDVSQPYSIMANINYFGLRLGH